MMKTHPLYCIAHLSLVASAVSLSAQGLLTTHTDISFSYSTTEGEWSGEFRLGTYDNPSAHVLLSERSLPARDFPAGGMGDRYVQPSNSSFDFTGVSPGDPLWIIPQGDSGYTWPGFRNDQTPGTFGAYDPQDYRLPSQPFKWIRIKLAGMNYVGSSDNPQFSVWNSSGPVVWMATSDGIDASDCYYLTENAHAHVNWGFSSLGLYRVAFEPSAILASSGETVEGTPEWVTFAIGTKASWLASFYSGDDLFDASVSGDTSDSDGDGVGLLLEYAFNLNPVLSDYEILEAGTGTAGLPVTRLLADGENASLQIEYIRRKTSTNAQISYFAEFSGDLSVDDWTVETTEQVTSINSEWERVIVTDPIDTSGADHRFARVRVVLQETIAY